jgi:hypothetical protein
MPADPRGRSEAIEWLFAALNSVEMASLPWSLLIFSGTGDTPESKLPSSCRNVRQPDHVLANSIAGHKA